MWWRVRGAGRALCEVPGGGELTITISILFKLHLGVLLQTYVGSAIAAAPGKEVSEFNAPRWDVRYTFYWTIGLDIMLR